MYYRHPRNADIELTMTLVNPDGTGATGKSPKLTIRRVRGVSGALDSFYWTGAIFQIGLFEHTMTEVDAVNEPGVYRYVFQNSLIALEQVYRCHGYHNSDPKGRDSEIHIMGRELPPVGSRQVTIRVQTAGAVRVPDTAVDIYANDNVTYWLTKRTDSNGEIVVALYDGTYKVRLVKANYSFTVPEVLTVTADQTTTFTATSFVAPIPSSPTLCSIFGTVLDANGKAIGNARIEAFAAIPQDQGGAQLGERVAHGATKADGTFSIDLVRNSKVRFKIDGVFDADRTVPNAANQDISTWDT